MGPRYQVGWRKGREKKKKFTVTGRMDLLLSRSKVNKGIRLGGGAGKRERFLLHQDSFGSELLRPVAERALVF